MGRIERLLTRHTQAGADGGRATWKHGLVLALVMMGCGDNLRFAPEADAPASRPDAPPMPAVDPANPATLADTGLCADAACTTIASAALAYLPRWQLWTDGAQKRRWVRLPPDKQIQTSNMDAWDFPVGTQLWKEFAKDGKKIETRYMIRTGEAPEAWYFVAFAWNDAQTEATAVPFGVTDALGTTHDIPSRGVCRSCHDQLPSRVLGMSAMQLDHAEAGQSVAALANAARLSHPPTGDAPYFSLGGDAVTQAALGYLYANCSHCHNPNSTVQYSTPLNFLWPVAKAAAPQNAPAYTTAVNQNAAIAVNGATKIIALGDLDGSASTLMIRFDSDVLGVRMPQLGSDVIDAAGRTILLTWMASLAN